MLTALLLSLAITASSQDDPILVIDPAPSIVISLAHYDLGKAGDVDRLSHRIVTSAKLVCEHGYRGIGYRETVACVQSAVADGKAQLGRLLAQNPSSAALTGSIAIAVPRE
jgi:UrcA family protein